MKTTKTMLIVIVLMTKFFSTTISIAQTYDYQNHGFTKTLENQRILVSGVITQEPQKNTFGKIKDGYYNFNFQNGEIRNATIGRHLGAVAYAIVKHGYAYDPGFNGFNFDDETADISNITAILLSPEAEVREITYADFKDYWETPLYIGDDFGNSNGSWANTLGIGFRMVKMKDLLGQKILFYNCKAIWHMGNGSPIAMNDPMNFDFEKFKKNPETGEPKWGYKDTVITKMMPGISFSDTPIAKPPKQEPKAPDICPPKTPDPNAVRQKEMETELQGAKGELADQKNKFADLEGAMSNTRNQLLEVTGTLGQAFDELIDTREQLAGLNKNIGGLNNDIANLKNQAAANEALADKHLSNVKAELMEANAKNDKTVGEMMALEDKLGQATELASQAKAESKGLAEKVTGLEYGIANQKAVHIAELSKLQSRQDSIVKAQKARDDNQDLETEKVKARVSKVEERVDKHDKLLDEHGNRLNALEAENKIQNTRLDANDAKNKSQDENIASNQEEIRKQKLALGTVEAGLKNDINALDTKTTNSFKTMDDKVTGVTKEVVALKNEVANVNKKADEAMTKAAQAEAKALALEKKIAADKLAQAQIDREQDTRNAEGINKAQARADQAVAENAALKTKMLEQKAQEKAILAANTAAYIPPKTTATTTTIPTGNTTAFDAMYNSKNKKVVRVANIIYEKGPPVIINDTMYVENASGGVDKYLLNCPQCPQGYMWKTN